jgi:hypothetical protein
MKVRLKRGILKPEEIAGPIGRLIDIPAGHLLDKLLRHRYVEPADPPDDGPSRQRLVDELSGVRELIGRIASATTPVTADEPADEDDESEEDYPPIVGGHT